MASPVAPEELYSNTQRAALITVGLVTHSHVDMTLIRSGWGAHFDGRELSCTIHVVKVLKADGGPAMRVQAGSDLAYRGCGGHVGDAGLSFLEIGGDGTLSAVDRKYGFTPILLLGDLKDLHLDRSPGVAVAHPLRGHSTLLRRIATARHSWTATEHQRLRVLIRHDPG